MFSEPVCAFVVFCQASNEIADPRLKCHLLTVLKSLHNPAQSKIQPHAYDSTIPVELFALLAEYEGEECPGAKLLAKAKELQWPILAIVALCFDDVKSVSCLFIWLKITAARFGLLPRS